ncbi:UPF0175 family protein [Catalinimonas sp. 4WD22]|uniref:UPF0175 family protein n=1 Tax=Catalinimonas locisalis TaxID=3133978 RepID=UPI0031013142
MAIIIDDKDIQQAQMTEKELRLEIAVMLYQQGRFSLGKASEFAMMNKILFQKVLAKRKIAANYDEEELKADRKTLGF